MELIARPQVAAVAVVVAAGGLIAAAPGATPSMPDVQVPNIGLTAELSDIQGSQTEAFYDLITRELSSNTNLVPDQVDLDKTFVSGGGNVLNGAVDRLFNVQDTLQDYHENSLNSLLGTNFDAGAIQNLLAGLDPAHAFGGGATGGLLGVSDQNPDQVANTANALGVTASNLLNQLPSFDENLIQAELAFNQHLVSSETTAAQQVFNGDVNPLNGLVNQLFNAHNAMLEQQENLLNNLLGASYAADEIHSSLLVGPYGDDGAAIGGLIGVFDQYLPSLGELVGFSQADWTDLFGVTASQWGDLFGATDANFFTDVLASLDWSSLFSHLS